jgi:hypothetical protein
VLKYTALLRERVLLHVNIGVFFFVTKTLDSPVKFFPDFRIGHKVVFSEEEKH